MQRGLFEEEANRNLDAAAQAYQAVSAQFDKDRKLAATAIFRLGEVYRKQGRTNDAVAQYERIVREFSEEQTLVTLSRQNLVGLGQETKSDLSSPGSVVADVTNGSLPDLEKELFLLKAKIEQAQKETNQQVLVDFLGDTNLLWAFNYNVAMERGYADAKAGKGELSAESREYSLKRSRVILKEAFDHWFATQNLRKRVLESAIAQAKGFVPKENTAPRALTTDDEEKEIRRIQAMIQNSPDLINAASLMVGANGESVTPLYVAAKNGQLMVARFLLDHGAGTEVKGGFNDTPLIAAATAGHKAMVELLLSKSADVRATDANGRTALHQAAWKGYQSVVETLLAHQSDINAKAKDGETPLYLSAGEGHSAMVTLLLEKGADPNLGNQQGRTPLLEAARRGHAAVVKALLAHKANLNLPDNEGVTALSYAAGNGHLEVVKLLLEGKADPNAGQKDSPLAMAAKSRQLEIARLLLQAGATPDLASKTSRPVLAPNQPNYSTSGNSFGPYTPLQIAVSQRDVPMIKLLLSFKANANATDPWFGPPRPLVFFSLDNAEMLKALLDGGANADSTYQGEPLIVAAAGRGDSMVEPLIALIAHGANVNVQDLRGYTPLRIAAMGEHKKPVELLLKAKADVNTVGNDGWTALHSAVGNGSGEIVELLLAHGANPSIKGNAGNTPLHWAVGIGDKGIGAQKMVELLLSKGADPNLRNNDGRTPLDLVKSTGTNYQPGPGLVPVAPLRNIPIHTLRQPVGSTNPEKTEPVDMAALLRQHGALDDLPKLDRIEVRRPETGFSKTILLKGTNDWNRFTLLDALAGQYFSTMTSVSNRIVYGSGVEPPFPDLHRVVVIRPNVKAGQAAKRITVDLLLPTGAVDCTKDMPLEFGDVVEIPEREHTLQESPVGLTKEEVQQIVGCREGTASLLVRGKRTELRFGPHWHEALIARVLQRSEVRSALFSSSDLSRLKVTRRDSASGEQQEWIVDCSGGKSPELLLRDGDVIEVPDKP